jgi:hypothetical protein
MTKTTELYCLERKDRQLLLTMVRHLSDTCQTPVRHSNPHAFQLKNHNPFIFKYILFLRAQFTKIQFSKFLKPNFISIILAFHLTKFKSDHSPFSYAENLMAKFIFANHRIIAFRIEISLPDTHFFLVLFDFNETDNQLTFSFVNKFISLYTHSCIY